MKTANLGAASRVLSLAAALTLSASFAGAQIVERSRTLADLLQSHPCNSGLAGRHTIVTDCDAADDLGNGGGAFSCFARCDGVDTWAAVSIGGGAGGSGEATSVQGSATLPATCTELDLYQDTNSGGTEFYVCTAADTWTKAGTGDVVGPASALDNEVARYDTTTGKLLQAGSLIKFLDPTGVTNINLKNVNGNLVVQDDIGSTSNIQVNSQSWVAPGGNRVGLFFTSFFSVASGYRIGFSSSATEAFSLDTSMVRSAAGIVGFTNATTGGGAIHLTPFASPPRTCDATAEGDMYADTSHVLCFCDGTSWNALTGSGAGSCV